MKRMMMSLTMVLGVLTAACGGDSPTGSSKPPAVSGAWRFTWANMVATVDGGSLICTAILDFNLTQTGSTFSGTQAGGVSHMTCTRPGEGTVVDDVVSGETIINGQFSGAQVSFRLGSVDGLNSGTISGTSMTGNASWTFVLSGSTSATMTGSWSAAKL